MVTAKKQLGIRFNSDRYEYLQQLETEMGMSKNALVEMMVDFYRTTHKGVSTLAKPSDSNGCSSSVSANTFSRGANTLKGMDATVALLEAKTSWLRVEKKANVAVAYYDGAIWLVGKDSHSQDIMKRLLDMPEVLFSFLARLSGPYSLMDCRAAVQRWSELKSMDGVDPKALGSGMTYFELDLFEGAKAKAIKASQAMAESTSAIEPANDEIAIEDNREPTSPVAPSNKEIAMEDNKEPTSLLNEPVVEQLEEAPKTMTNAQFRAWLELEDTTAFGEICKLGSTKDGYLAKDGSTWFKSGSGKKASWSTKKPATQLALALV